MSVEPTGSEPMAVEGLLYFVSYEPQIHTSTLSLFFLCSEAAESRVYIIKVKTVQNLAFSYFCSISEMCRGTGERRVKRSRWMHTHCWEERRWARAPGDSCRLGVNRWKVKSPRACSTSRTCFSFYTSMRGRKESQASAQRDCHRHSRKPLRWERWHVSFWGSLQSIAMVDPALYKQQSFVENRKGNIWNRGFCFCFSWDKVSLCSTASGTHFWVLELKVWTPPPNSPKTIIIIKFFF